MKAHIMNCYLQNDCDITSEPLNNNSKHILFSPIIT